MPYLDSEGLAYLVEKIKEQSSSGNATYPGIRVVQLKASEWLDGNVQTEIVFGVKSSQKNQTIVPEPVYSQKDLYDQCGIEIQSKTENQVTFHADTLPTEDLTLYLTIFDLNPNQEETVLDHIQVTQMPDKIRYVKDTPFDPTGLKVKAFFSNDLSFDVGLESLTFSPNASIPLGTTTITVAFNWGGIEKTASIPVTVIKAYVYGANIPVGLTRGSRGVRTDDAAGLDYPVPYSSGMNENYPSSPFDDIYPWREMTVEDRPHGRFVKIPKFYYKLTGTNVNPDDASSYRNIQIQICSEKLDGYHVSPLHQARRITRHSVMSEPLKEIPYAYVSAGFVDTAMKKASNLMIPASNSVGYNSLKGFIDDETLLNDNVYAYDITAWFTIILLFLVEYCTFDSQGAIGNGLLDKYSWSTISPINKPWSIPYHTGTESIIVVNNGKEYVANPVMYRNIQNLWGMPQLLIGLSTGSKVTGSYPTPLWAATKISQEPNSFGQYEDYAEFNWFGTPLSYSTTSSGSNIGYVSAIKIVNPTDFTKEESGFPFFYPRYVYKMNDPTYPQTYTGQQFITSLSAPKVGGIDNILTTNSSIYGYPQNFVNQIMSINSHASNGTQYYGGLMRFIELPQTENEERNDDMNKYSPPVT